MRHICFPMLLYLVPPDHMFQRCCLQFVIWERNLFHIVIATLFCIIATPNQFEHHQLGSEWKKGKGKRGKFSRKDQFLELFVSQVPWSLEALEEWAIYKDINWLLHIWSESEGSGESRNNKQNWKSVLRKVLLVLNACTEQCYCVETSSGELRYVIQGNLLRASCYSAKDTLSATVQRIRYVRRVSPAYDSCSRSRRGETSCLLARWRGKQDQMRETIAQAKRQVGVKRSSRKIGKI